jgi:hypothetical protein
MELKKAVAVCLISLFSATLVVLIARSLDNQAASRLEPQLASIVEELRALRAQGGVATTSAGSPQAETVHDGLMVYYFHSNTRCPTCQSIESQANDAVHADFAAQIAKGEVIWKVLNYEQPASAPLAQKFDVQMPVVVLAKMKDGRIQDSKRLDKVWALVGDKPAFAKFVREEIERMLAPGKKPAAATAQASAPPLPTPDAGSKSAEKTPEIPVP